MNLNFNELLRVLSALLILLLIVQGLDLIFGFGVNKYVFIFFCIVFAFTMGSIYHNIIMERNRKIDAEINRKVDNLQSMLDEKISKEGLTDELLMCQDALKELRVELGLD